MAGAVEAVAADLVLLIELIRQGIGVGHRGHGLMEGGVKHGDHGGAGHQGLAGADADDVGGVVQGGQVALLNGGHDLVGDEDGLGELLAAMDHAVTHRVDLLHGADHAVLGIHQGVQNGLDGLGVGGHGHVGVLDGLLAGGLIGELAVQANALTQALGQDLLSVGVEQLILQRGAAGVDDKNVHGNRSPFQCSRSSEAFSHLRAVWALCSPDGSGNAGQRRDVQFGKARLAFGAGLVVH